MARRTIVVMSTALALFAGCIVSDQLTTITIRPDGSADWMRFQSNIRSTEKGEKGQKELKAFVEEFDAHRDSDYARITQAGGEVLESRWVRREEPYANIVVARFASESAFLAFCTVKGEKGETLLQPLFTHCGSRRRFSMVITAPRVEKPVEDVVPTVEQLRQNQANGLSETRVVVAGGRIVDWRGFTVAADRRSALFDPARIEALLRAGEKVELFLEWELAGELAAD